MVLETSFHVMVVVTAKGERIVILMRSVMQRDIPFEAIVTEPPRLLKASSRRLNPVHVKLAIVE
jgi:hypothetical protein